MKYCRACILPDTRPNLVLGPDGVCNGCRAAASKPRIDWARRREAFRKVVAEARGRQAPYDCVVPVSGGKDSTWQVVTCLEHGLRPLTVSWRPPARTAIGARNLANLVGLGVDHIDFQVDPRVESRFMGEALARFGDPAIPMHLAIFNLPRAISVRFGVPLVVWGENSAFEYGAAREEPSSVPMDAEWVRRFGATHGTTAEDWVSDRLSRRDLAPYFGPSDEEAAARGVRAVFLGDFFPWDPAESLRVARAHGFQPRPEGPKTGIYDYADIDDDFISVHHWIKWYKFGFTRSFDNLSLEIRNGRMARDEAIRKLRERGDETPHGDIDAFCRFAGLPREKFSEIAERFRNRDIWVRRNGHWEIPGFLIPDWEWT